MAAAAATPAAAEGVPVVTATVLGANDRGGDVVAIVCIVPGANELRRCNLVDDVGELKVAVEAFSMVIPDGCC